MADKVTHSYDLKLNCGFADEDTRMLSIADPNESITGGGSVASAMIEDLSDYIRQNQILLGDKTGAAFTRILSAKVIYKSVTDLDLAVS